MNNNYTYETEDEEDEDEESVEDEEDDESLEDEEEESLEDEEDDESLEDDEDDESLEDEEEESLEEEPLEEEEDDESLEDEEDDESLEDEKEESLEDEEDDESLEDEEEESLEECTTSRKRSRFTTLTKSNIKKLQKTKINEVSSNLSITKSEACLLLIHHGWSATKVDEAWFDDKERVRKLVGLLKHNSGEIVTTQTCEICFDNTVCLEKKLKSAKCGHAYCVDCWKRYINEKIKEGRHECLKPMRCPHPSCEASLEINMIRRFASQQNRKMYDRFLLRSYVETRKNIKWCPRPDCDLAVRYKSDGNYVNKYVEVSCRNGHRFCWGCGEDAHRPVSCEMMAQKNQESGDSKSLRWISTFTKKCPSCKQPIERNGGCMHVTCTVCSYQFCWLCLSDWFLCSARCNRF
ncbi:putative E3 ubiquitin-protein ligase [Arachis hypogaea]|nr:putative E3 ubiquitin-protein ligase [Arachis hypogaea]